MTFEYYNRSSTTATGLSKNKKHLTLETVPRHQRKYLGEPDDPHFIPKSPIIERQQFTEQEEGELKRLCALALVDVPHSDGPEPVVPPSAARATANPPAVRKASAPVQEVIKPPQPQFVDDSRTPSEASRRDTLGTATDYSTPLTSAGITPGEPVKRFSSSKTQNSSHLRYDQWQQQNPQQRGKSHTHPPPSKHPQQNADSHQPRPDSQRKSAVSVPGERTLRFVNDSRDPSPSSTKLPEVSKSKTSLKLSPDSSSRSNRYSTAELNKSLPPLPVDLVSRDDAPKTAPLARMLKTMTGRKSSPHEDAPTSPLERPGTSLAWSRSAPASPAVGGDGGRRKFLKLFARKDKLEHASSNMMVAVS